MNQNVKNIRFYLLSLVFIVLITKYRNNFSYLDSIYISLYLFYVFKYKIVWKGVL